MAKHYTCDICSKPLDKVISIQKADGMLYVPIEGSSTDMNIHLAITNPAQSGTEICFQCIVDEMRKLITRREEVIEKELTK